MKSQSNKSLVLSQLAPFDPDQKRPDLLDDQKWQHLSKHDESIRAKWQHLQYFEDVNDSSYNSLSNSSSNSSSSNKENESKFKKLKKLGWRKIKAQFNVGSKRMSSTSSYNDLGYDEVSRAPDGSDDVNSTRIWPNPVAKIRSSKSMQNLEQITRDSYYNLRDATSNLKEKYHSRLELRQSKPKANYEIFWDEGCEEQIRLRNMAMVGLA